MPLALLWLLPLWLMFVFATMPDQGISSPGINLLPQDRFMKNVRALEADMYRCHPQIARLAELIREGAVGSVRHVRAVFGFAARFDPASRLLDRNLAGGGILDVGG